MPAKDEGFVPYTFDDVYDEEVDKEHKGKLRQLIVEDGNVFTMECEDPYGHWKVRVKKGTLPDSLKDNSFTTFRDCLTAVNQYLAAKKKPIVYGITKEKPVKESLFTKE